MAPSNKRTGKVRIIGGELRSRIVHFPTIQQLRPSPDAVRETLFNWLMPYIQQSNCLDLYSGSGILAFEALSRGAKTATLIDNQPAVTKSLENNATLLNVIKKIKIICSDTEKYLTVTNHQYDIIFLDPPFAEADYQRLFRLMTKFNILAPNGLIYVEHKKSTTALPIMPNWEIIRHKILGIVQSTLIQS